MNNILLLNTLSTSEVAKLLAERIKARRLELNLTQQGLAARACINFSTYRRFEQTGEISLKNLLDIAFALNILTDFENLFTQRQYQNLQEVLNEQNIKRKRGKRNE